MKKLNVITLLMLLSFSLFAKKVEIELAQDVAKNYYSMQLEQIKKQINAPPIINETIVLNRKGESLIYVFNFEKGFVMVSAHDEFTPVLGFSFEGKYIKDNQPPAFVELLESYKDQISYTIKVNPINTKEIAESWKHYSTLNNTRTRSDCKIWPKYFTKDALLTTTWDQGCYYNEICASDSRSTYCGKALTGCVATAMAQVMKYWNYPSTGSGSHGYTDGSNNAGSYGYLFANFAGTTYNWSSMPNNVTSSSNAVATLMYHCGVSVNMDYGYEQSTTTKTALSDTLKNSLINYFKYAPTAQFITRIPANESYWEGYLRNELDNNRPIIYSGAKTISNGHVFVIDGYTKMQTECCTYAANFHVNWGWGGNLNGYYLLSNMQGYNYGQAALIGIKPATYTYAVPAAPNYISEPACSPHCRYSEVDYFVPSVPNASYYEWNITGITGVAVISNGCYGTISTHRYGTGTLWCRAVNSNGIAGPWRTRPITISNCTARLGDDDAIVNIFPNPAANNIYITLPDYENYTKADLLDMQGKLLKTVLINSPNTIIDTENIKNGLYLIKLTSNHNPELRKISILK